MSKIYIKSNLKTKNEDHFYEGKGIKTNNKITYNDDGILTTITLGELIILERNKDYQIKMGFKINEKIKGTYTTSEGNFKLETKTNHLKITQNSIKIKYELIINNVFIDSFDFNLQYTIDR